MQYKWYMVSHVAPVFLSRHIKSVRWLGSWDGFDCGATGLQVKLARPLPPCGSVLGLTPVVEAGKRLDKGPNHWKLPLLLLKLLVVANCEDGLTGCCSACNEMKSNGLLLCPSVGPFHFHSCQMFRESAKCRRLYPSG